jgi:hypothetical protein
MNGKIDMLAAALERTIVESTPTESHPQENQLNRPRNLSIDSSKQRSIYEDKFLTGTSLECITRTTFQSTDRFFGMMRISSVSRQYISTGISNEEAENYGYSEKGLTLNILLRFGSCRKGFKLRINDTFDDWCLNSIRRLPNESAVFKLCEEGNALEIEKLFAFRKASVYDVNETGQSILHVSRLSLTTYFPQYMY